MTEKTLRTVKQLKPDNKAQFIVKRVGFQYNVNKNTIEQDGKFVAYVNCVDGFRIANKLNALQKENEKLKQSYTKLKHRHDLLHDEYVDAECERYSLKKEVESLEKENEQLKKSIKEEN